MAKPVLVEAISLSELRPGITLPAPIYDARNPSVLLLGEGTRLTSQNLERLQQRGVNKVAIDSRHAADISIKKVEPEKKPSSAPKPPPDFRKAANKPLNSLLRKPEKPEYSKENVQKFNTQREKQGTQLASTLEALKYDSRVNSKPLHSIAIESAEMMVDDLDLYVKCTIDPQDADEVYAHCLRVGQLAMAMATVAGHTTSEVQQLGMGCLLSRAGLTEAARDLTAQSRSLSVSDLIEVQKNPCRTFDLLQDVTDIPVGSRQVAYQMFERWNGSGYPRGRAGTQIHPLARIAAVADVYVALTSPRPHRPPFSSYRAVEQLIADTRKGLFDPGAIRSLLQTVSLYPLGTIVRLTDGCIAAVLRTNKESYDSPVVRLLLDADGKKIEDKTVDLMKSEWLSVANVLDDDEAAELLGDDLEIDFNTEPNAEPPVETASALPELPNLPELQLPDSLAKFGDSAAGDKTAGRDAVEGERAEGETTAEGSSDDKPKKQLQFAFD